MASILKDSILVRELVSIFGYLICLLFHIAMSTTHWAVVQTNKNGGYLSFGLWSECKITRVSRVCHPFYTGDEDVYKGNEWKNGSQILMLVALVSILAQVFLALSIMLVEKINRSLREAFGVLMCLLGSYFTCSLLVLLIFSHEITKIERTQLTWSFYIIPCSMGIDIISCILGAPIIDKESKCCSNRTISIISNKEVKNPGPSGSNTRSNGDTSESSSQNSYESSGFKDEPIQPRNGNYARKYRDENGVWMVSF